MHTSHFASRQFSIRLMDRLKLATIFGFVFATIAAILVFKTTVPGAIYLLALLALLQAPAIGAALFNPGHRELKALIALLALCAISVVLQHLLLKDCIDRFGRSVHAFTLSTYLQNACWAFAGGGRASFYIGVGSILVYELLFVTARWRVAAFVLLGSALGALLALWLNIDLEQVEKMLFLRGLEADSSFLERSDALERELKMFPAQAAIGDPGLIVKEYGSIGIYIHNILSAWQFCGSLPFVGLLALLLYLLPRVQSFAKADQSPMATFSTLCFIYAVIGSLVAKYVGFFHLWFALGFWVSLLHRYNRRPVSTNRSPIRHRRPPVFSNYGKG